MRFSIFLAILYFCGQAQAAPVMNVGLDKTSLYRLPEPAGGIVVGNPDIVTVSLHDVRTLLLIGKRVGDTELIVMDRSGSVLRHFDLSVLRQNRNELTVVRRGRQEYLHCGEKCHPVR